MGSSFDINESPQWIDCFIRSFSNDNHLIEQSNDTNTTLYQNQDFTLASSIDGLYQPTDDNYEFTSIQDCSERLSNFMESYSPPILEIPSFLEISPSSFNISRSPNILQPTSNQQPVKIEASEAKKTPSPAVAKKIFERKERCPSLQKNCPVSKGNITPRLSAGLIKKSGTFKVEDQDKIAELWAIMKKKKKFCYGNFSRSIRHHHHTGYLVHDRRKLIFKFSPDFTFWK
ncbi:SPIC [Lepeophtheirus salmonis]|uniref:SPIC n=1 Tax=Lepeophtheirus salmonis TaxID=72036 RepID=A0A7R8CDG0_LEPSM|nr:SPIC [Lepeophtheirus salmonis]CAF2779529.1 SPIC [Lepeophtheirus salmonis]